MLQAHHPDFIEIAATFDAEEDLSEEQREGLREMAPYFDWFLDAVCDRKSQQFDFLTAMLQLQGRMEDALDSTITGGMHALCELAMWPIRV